VPTDRQASARRGRPARFTTDELLDVVVAEFNARGYDATSMEDLARATGLTKSAVYHHVAGKEALLRLALTRAVDALFAVLDEPASRTGPAVDRLAHVVRRAAEVLVALLPYVTLLLRVRGNTGSEQWALERRREFDRRLALLVQDAIEAGDVRADVDPRLVTRLLFGMVNSTAEWYRPGGAHGPDEVADAVVAVAFDGLRSRGPGVERRSARRSTRAD
jgi:AcrR family transcriptional regulator